MGVEITFCVFGSEPDLALAGPVTFTRHSSMRSLGTLNVSLDHHILLHSDLLADFGCLKFIGGFFFVISGS